MNPSCDVDGVSLPLGHDDVREYLAQFGEVREHPLLSPPWPEGSTWLALLCPRRDVVRPARISAYPSRPNWTFWATSPGGSTSAFVDLTKAVAHAFPSGGPLQ